MTYNPNANWTTKASAKQQQPVYFIVVDGISYRISTGIVSGATVTYKQYLELPTGQSQKIYPLKGKASIGSLTLKIIDVNNEISSLMAPGNEITTWINNKVTLYGGYAGLDESDYAVLFVGECSGYSYKDGLYTITLRDLKRTALEDIMTNATDASPTTISGNPIDIWYAISTSDFSNATFPVTTSGSTPTGLGISSSLIDETALETERDTWLTGWNMEFNFYDKTDASSFFSSELFKLVGYPVVMASGKLSVKIYHAQYPGVTSTGLTTEEIMQEPSIKPEFKYHLNKITINGDYTKGADPEYSELASWEDSSDITNTKETASLEINSKGLRTSLNGEVLAKLAIDKLKQRYLVPPYSLNIKTLFSKRAIEASDIVNITLPNLPSTVDGSAGWSDEPCEIISAQPDYVRGVMKFALLQTRFGTQYRLIGASTLNDYTSQTTAQQAKYASICSASTEQFSNSDAGHQLM